MSLLIFTLAAVAVATFFARPRPVVRDHWRGHVDVVTKDDLLVIGGTALLMLAFLIR